MRRFAVGLAVLLALAGCSSAPPRLTDRGPVVTADLYPRLVRECVRQVNGMAGVDLRVVQPMPADVELRVVDSGRLVSPARLSLMEQQLETCLERFPLDLDPVDYRRTPLNDLLVYQYYVGPLTRCLEEHDIFLGDPPTLGEFRHRDFPRNPYTTMVWRVERLARIHHECPPLPPVVLDDGARG